MGRTYIITTDVLSGGGAIGSSGDFLYTTSVGSYTHIFKATSDTFAGVVVSAGGVATVDNISVKEVLSGGVNINKIVML